MNTKTMRRRGTAAALTGAMLAGAGAIAYFSTQATSSGDVTGATISLTANGETNATVTFGDLYPVPARTGQSQPQAVAAFPKAAAFQSVTLANDSTIPVDVHLSSVGAPENIWVAVCDGAIEAVDTTCEVSQLADTVAGSDPIFSLEASDGELGGEDEITRRLYVWLEDDGTDQSDFAPGGVTFTFEARNQ